MLSIVAGKNGLNALEINDIWSVRYRRVDHTVKCWKKLIRRKRRHASTTEEEE